MFQPVGDLPPSVYWRRRFAVLFGAVALVVLLALTVHVLTSGGSTDNASGAPGTGAIPPPATTTPTRSLGTSTAAPSTPSTSTAAPSTPSTSTAAPSTSSTSASSTSASASSPPPAPCMVSHLDVSAAVEKDNYSVGQSPTVALLIKNPSSRACVQDLSDKQIVISVYNGESRVWGSHDCKIEPGTDLRTLMPGASVRISIVWSGQSSTPNTCDPRQQVGAGNYTVYASLAGRRGRAAQFTIT